MTNTEALHILKCNSIEDVEDAYENFIFNFKGKLLQIIPPLKLLAATRIKIERINQAYVEFYALESHSDQFECNINQQLSLSSFLGEYQIRISEIKLKVANCFDGKLLCTYINFLIELQEELYIKLAAYITIDEQELNKFEIKLSESIDVFKIQEDLKELDLEDTKISEYIRNQIKELTIDSMSNLTKSVLNSTKQIVFNGISRKV